MIHYFQLKGKLKHLPVTSNQHDHPVIWTQSWLPMAPHDSVGRSCTWNLRTSPAPRPSSADFPLLWAPNATASWRSIEGCHWDPTDIGCRMWSHTKNHPTRPKTAMCLDIRTWLEKLQTTGKDSLEMELLEHKKQRSWAFPVGKNTENTKNLSSSEPWKYVFHSWS